eukprot:TRINITY_DN9801_c0_g1_i4.p1 TRINITY_DN9801_c0_g1~~TRINITY_DN9801_c0_g1_i4.p1  ORF type:complete len:299 (-),score=32.36 TRINITY_DN9801_c0_g1_i4:278-1174(-)
MTLQQSSWKQTAKLWCDAFIGHGIACSGLYSRPSASSTGDGIIVFKAQLPQTNQSGGHKIVPTEIEVVTPWNNGYFPAQNMDFSCNNLQLEPNSNCELRQCFTIMMTSLEIATQLLHRPQPHASPTRDCDWIPYDKKEHPTPGEGVSGRMYVKGTTDAMKVRLEKFRKKGFLLVEQPHVSVTGNTVVLFHGTDAASMKGILASKAFIPSKKGNFGPGTYMSRDMSIVNLFAKPHILRADVDPGRIYIVPKGQTDPNGNWRTVGSGSDTAFLSAANSWRSMEEWCIVDPSRIKNIHQHI